MCGLFASIGIPPDPARLDIVAHRGPDGRGWLVLDSAAGPIALGHRRLAIIDVSDAARQPMVDPTGHCHLVFNGELYNFIELRDELKARGEKFVTQSDSEVLLRAYMVWGEECLPRLRGMFAFLIWDDRTQRLFAARDRYGIKPLYIAQTARTLALGSEIKQLIGLPSVPGAMNVSRVHDFLTSAMSDHTPETMFQGVSQLRGGECLTVDVAAGRVTARVRRWYPLPQERARLPENAAAARYLDLLKDSVRIHLRSDVPVGSCLSGGLDSSSIVCLMADMLPQSRKVHTVSACYREKRVDERPFIDAVVTHAGTEPIFVYPKPADLLAKASDIIWHQDEPFGSTSIFAQWCVFEAAKKNGVKVMLDGQGADEQLAGYHFAFGYHLAALLRQARLVTAMSVIRERSRVHGAPLTDQAKHLAAALLPHSAIKTLQDLQRLRSPNPWLRHGFKVHAGRSAMATACADLDLARPYDVASLCQLMTFASNLQMLLHWEDRNSMAHSVEARVPFLDHPVVEFALALGNDHKIVGTDTKRVLRRAMTEVLPEAVLTRSDKLGFATPEAEWFRGPLRQFVTQGIELACQRFPEVFHPPAVHRMAKEMLRDDRRFDFSLWRIVCLGIWGERFRVTM